MSLRKEGPLWRRYDPRTCNQCGDKLSQTPQLDGRKATRFPSGPGDPSTAGCSVESEFYRDSRVARADTGDEEICALVQDRGRLRRDEDVVCVWGSEMAERVLVVEELFSLDV